MDVASKSPTATLSPPASGVDSWRCASLSCRRPTDRCCGRARAPRRARRPRTHSARRGSRRRARPAPAPRAACRSPHRSRRSGYGTRQRTSRPCTAGAPITSATRSSSVAPFGTATGLPAQRPGLERQRRKLAAGKAGVRQAARDRDARRRAQQQARNRPLVDPAPLAVVGAECEHPIVDAAHAPARRRPPGTRAPRSTRARASTLPSRASSATTRPPRSPRRPCLRRRRRRPREADRARRASAARRSSGQAESPCRRARQRRRSRRRARAGK